MSNFYLNKISPKTITFNTEDVSTVYFENTQTMTEPVLVWSRWPGWKGAGWEDIYNLCKMKQAGIITEWPEDIKLGATKYISVRQSVNFPNTAYSMVFEIIGIDIDGPGVLTFMSLFSVPDLNMPTLTLKYDSEFFELLTSYGPNEFIPLRDYIKPLKKQWYHSIEGKIVTTEALMWDLSYAEAGLESNHPCFTEGVSTPYFTAPPNRAEYWHYNTNPIWQVCYGAREYYSIDFGDGNIQHGYNSNKTFGTNTAGATGIYTVPCFAIG